ncbi:hypothetical protein CCH79_00019517, partial [Gambusia affinis]
HETHRIRKDRENFYPFVFTDTRGLEEQNGVSENDIKLALMGHVKEGYQYNPVSPLSAADPGYNSTPSIDDRVHVLVCVCSAWYSHMRPSILQKMMSIREAASDLGIPQLAVLTNIDCECSETEKSLRNVYRSKYFQKRMRDFSSSLGIPMNRILPVKNYSHETQLDPDVDTLILNALRRMIDFGDDYAEKLCISVSVGVPQLAVLTKIDEACIDTKINLRNVYRSKSLKKKISDLHSSLGIPESHILPVKNYSHKIQTCSDVVTLILTAVRRMILFHQMAPSRLSLELGVVICTPEFHQLVSSRYKRSGRPTLRRPS